MTTLRVCNTNVIGDDVDKVGEVMRMKKGMVRYVHQDSGLPVLFRHVSQTGSDLFGGIRVDFKQGV